jgi:exopolysaccharide biosynthesis polyprenyl glycosylphosphotransferase
MTLREPQARSADEKVSIPDLDEHGAVNLSEVLGGVDSRIIDLTGLRVGASALRRYRLVGLFLIPLDIACLAIALLVAYALRFDALPDWDYLVQVAWAALLWPAVFYALGLYAPQHLSGLEEFRRTAAAVGIGIVVLILLAFWSDVYVARSWMAIALAIALVLELTARMLVRAYVAHLRARGPLMLRTLVIGTKDQVDEPIRLLRTAGSGYLPMAWIDASNPILAAADVSAAERVSRLRVVFRHYRPDCIFMASTSIGSRQMFAVMQAARQEGVVVKIYTDLSGVWVSRLAAHPLGSEGVALTIKPAGLSTSQRFIKRSIDLVLGTVGLILASPVLLLAALGVRVTSAGPILFRQERVTEGARTFVMYKFRTMTNGAEKGARENGFDTSAPFFKIQADPRLTRVGKVLRRWSIDELPQLFNVLLGDMSLVGPRPLPAEQVSANIELLGPRHEVRSGITGWWQIQGRSDLDHEEAIRKDHFYIENWSPALDGYIMLRTVRALLSRKGAY